MDNENKWEYDYSTLYNSSGANAGGTGYVNVGSSGTNSANQYDTSDRSASQNAAGGSAFAGVSPQPEAGGPPQGRDKKLTSI